MPIPYIDPTVRHVWVSYLRKLTAEILDQQTDTLVIHGKENKPVAVIIPWEIYLRMQVQSKGSSNVR